MMSTKRADGFATYISHCGTGSVDLAGQSRAVSKAEATHLRFQCCFAARCGGSGRAEVLRAGLTVLRATASQAVGRQQRKPSAGDLEVAFYNAAAASSPITRGVKFVKSITGSKK